MLVFFTVFLTAAVVVALLAIHSFRSIRAELSGRSAYYKKKRGYKGVPSLAKTFKLALVTPHLRLQFHKCAFFWVLSVGAACAFYALV